MIRLNFNCKATRLRHPSRPALDMMNALEPDFLHLGCDCVFVIASEAVDVRTDEEVVAEFLT